MQATLHIKDIEVAGNIRVVKRFDGLEKGIKESWGTMIIEYYIIYARDYRKGSREVLRTRGS